MPRCEANETVLYEKETVAGPEDRDPLITPQVYRTYTGTHMIPLEEPRASAISAKQAGVVGEGTPSCAAPRRPFPTTTTADPLMHIVLLGASVVVISMIVSSMCSQSAYRGTSSYRSSVAQLLSHIR